MTENAKEKDARYLSVLMQKISEFAQNYGVDELISYLCDYQKDIAQDEYKKYKLIEKVSCEVWDLPIADLDTAKQGGVNKSVRMIITYLTNNYTKINMQQLSLMMKAELRTLQYYIDDIKYRMEHKAMFSDFCEKLELIKEKTNCL